MKYCDKYAALISAGVDNALTADERRKLMDHLAECPACREAYTQMLAMHEAFEGWEEELPRDLTGDVMAQIRKEKAVSKRRKRAWLPMAAAAACCALVFIGYHAMPSPAKNAVNDAAEASETAGSVVMTDDTKAEVFDDSALYQVAAGTAAATDECEEHILEGVLTYFRSAPAAMPAEIENAADEPLADDLTAEDERSVPILTCHESALVDWMAENTSVAGYTAETSETGVTTTAWLISAEECEALIAYLDDATLPYSTAWEQFHADFPLPSDGDLVCVVYLPAQAEN